MWGVFKSKYVKIKIKKKYIDSYAKIDPKKFTGVDVNALKWKIFLSMPITKYKPFLSIWAESNFDFNNPEKLIRTHLSLY